MENYSFNKKLLKHLRKDNNFTQEQLATICGITQKTISRWEFGQSVPPTSLLSVLAKVFNLSMNDFLIKNK